MEMLGRLFQLLVNAISGLLMNLVAALLGVFSVVIFLQVLTRFVIKMPLAWTEEVSRFLFIWMVFLGSALGVRKLMHYRIVMLIQALPEKPRRIMDFFVNLFVLCFFGLVFIHSLDFFETIKMQRSPVLQISMGVPYSSVVAFGLSGCLFSLEVLARNLRNIFMLFRGSNR